MFQNSFHHGFPEPVCPEVVEEFSGETPYFLEILLTPTHFSSDDSNPGLHNS
jgi:hypothetical protein